MNLHLRKHLSLSFAPFALADHGTRPCNPTEGIQIEASKTPWPDFRLASKTLPEKHLPERIARHNLAVETANGLLLPQHCEDRFG